MNASRRAGPLALLAAAAVLAAAAWWSRSGEPSGAPAGPRPAPAIGAGAGPAPAPDLPDPAVAARAPAAAPEPGPGAAVVDPAGAPAPARGVLRGLRDGAPIAGATLELTPAGGAPLRVRTDAEGRFETAAPVPPGMVRARHVEDLDQPGLAARLDVHPASFWVAGAGAPPQELRLELPERWLAVRAVLPDGSPAPGAVVESRHGTSRTTWWFAWPVRAGAGGIARVPLEERADRVRLHARAPGHARPEHVEVLPPWPSEPVVLRLEPAGRLRVHAVDPGGRPLEGCQVTAGRDLCWVRGVTDGRGEVVLGPLPPGDAFVSARHPATGTQGGRSARVALEREELVEVEVPVAPLELAAAGVVVDGSGAPLAGVEVRLDGAPEWAPRAATTCADGRFELHAVRTSRLRVVPPGSLDSDVFEPAVAEVEFGARDLVFRRVRSDPPLVLTVAVRDSTTGALVRGAEGVVFTPSVPGRPRGTAFDAGAGVATIAGRRYPDLTVAAWADGYRPHEALVADLPTDGGDPPTVTLELEPGFEHTLVVRDLDSGRPVAAAAVELDGRVVARTDAEGRAVVDLPLRPPALTVTHPDYDTEQVPLDPDMMPDHDETRVHLDPR